MEKVVKEVRRSESTPALIFILLATAVELYLIFAFVWGLIKGAGQRELFLLLGLAFAVLTLILLVYSLKFLEMKVIIKRKRYKPETRERS